MLIISFRTRFTVSFKALKSQQVAVSNILNKNGFGEYSTWIRTPFDNIIEFRVDCNIRQAELIRQLIHNFKIYE